MDRFVVGSGRCGSTLLSRMLAEDGATLSIFEFFNGLDIGRRFAPEPTTGDAFAELLSREQVFVTEVLRRGYRVDEIVYPFERARFRRDEPLPWILVGVLPRISDDPDALYDETLAHARALPRQPLAAHYRALFDWLAEHLGRAHWIERSGSSIEYVGALHTLFPDARFLHLHRDGREAALSMREHPAYRLAIAFLYGLQPPGDPDPVGRVLESRPPVEWYGRYWSDQLLRGYRDLPALDAAQFRALRFEDLVQSPHDVLPDVADFLGLSPDASWLARAAALVRGVPPTRFETLPASEQQALAEACRPGMELLGRV